MSREEIEALAGLAPVDEIFSWKSPSARQYAAGRGRLTDGELIDLMLNEARLIRRPMIVLGNRIVVGMNEPAIQALLKIAG